MGSTVLEFFRCIIKPSGCLPRDFMCIFRILNPVDPLASASNLYLYEHAEWTKTRNVVQQIFSFTFVPELRQAFVFLYKTQIGKPFHCNVCRCHPCVRWCSARIMTTFTTLKSNYTGYIAGYISLQAKMCAELDFFLLSVWFHAFRFQLLWSWVRITEMYYE